MERVTLQTIADTVGVSRTTVSNAFSRPDQLNAELRRRILDVAEELGYPGPNAAARTLRRGRAGVVGVLFTETLSYAFADPYAVGFLRGLAGSAQEAGTGLLLVTWPSLDAVEGVIADAVVDGFCVYSMPDGHPCLEAARRRRLPIVTVDGPHVPGLPFVGVDARTAGRQLAAHLLDLGHRRVGVAAAWLLPEAGEGPVRPDRAQGRSLAITGALLAGYRDAFAAAGAHWDDVPVYQGPNDPGTGGRAVTHLLDRADAPTAILATTDQIALGVMGALAARGLDVPRDVSVVGFDDIPDAAAAGLTTVRQPIEGKGRTAGRVLLARDRAPARTIMEHRLVLRSSTAAPRHR